MSQYEIERKYLIRMPDAVFLEGQPGCAVWEIEQIYLRSEPGTTRRVRRVKESGEERWYKTFKQRVSSLTAQEDEGRITREEYERFCVERDPARNPVIKTRYRIPYEGQVLEFDLYPFWKDRAVLEIELESESQTALIPEWVHVIKEVTEDYRYKNVRLASDIPMDKIQ